MTRIGLRLCSVLLAVGVRSALSAQDVLVFPGANSRETHFTIHNIRRAHEITRGQGVAVGILDHSFGMDVHPDLYAGGRSFQTGPWGDAFRTESHHGYWMSLVLREVAPEVDIFALGTYSSDEGELVDAMVRAIDWAIEHDLDVLTYSAAAFSPEARARLDPAVERAVRSGIVIAFIHYPHPDNLLPTWLGPSTGDDGREADLNILHYDYSVVFVDRYRAWMNGDEGAGAYRPFLSASSMAPVTAGLVAFLRSVDPALSPEDCKRILMQASRPMTYDGQGAARVPDAYQAVLLAGGR